MLIFVAVCVGVRCVVDDGVRVSIVGGVRVLASIHDAGVVGIADVAGNGVAIVGVYCVTAVVVVCAEGNVWRWCCVTGDVDSVVVGVVTIGVVSVMVWV